MDFKSRVPFEERLSNSQNIISKYPDRIPIICEKSKSSKDTPNIDKNKYLVPNDLTIGQFIYVIRKRLHLHPEKGLYLFIQGTIPPSSAMIINIYNDYHDDDGFLYVHYSSENTFG